MSGRPSMLNMNVYSVCLPILSWQSDERLRNETPRPTAKLEALRNFALPIATVMSGPGVLHHENAKVLSLAGAAT